MPVELSMLEARILGSLIEKEITTPEHYPLSLNALTNACNQKSNREPVMDLPETAVQETVDGLVKRFLVSNQTGYGSRVTKYQQRLCNTHFGGLRFSPQELAIVGELLLRGPQTPGELRVHASRMSPFDSVERVEDTLRALAEREDGPFVVRLPREPGRREARYSHLFCSDAEDLLTQIDNAPTHVGFAQTNSPANSPADSGQMAALEQRVAALEAEVAALKELLEDLTAG